MNKIIFLEQQLGDKISPYIYAFGEKKIELKSAYQGLKILLNCGDGDFEVYKDAIASCVFAIANTQSDDLLFNEKKAVGDLHALYNFFCDLQKDVKGIEE